MIMKVIEKYDEEIKKAKEEGRTIIACMCNNEVKSLNYDLIVRYYNKRWYENIYKRNFIYNGKSTT